MRRYKQKPLVWTATAMKWVAVLLSILGVIGILAHLSAYYPKGSLEAILVLPNSLLNLGLGFSMWVTSLVCLCLAQIQADVERAIVGYGIALDGHKTPGAARPAAVSTDIANDLAYRDGSPDVEKYIALVRELAAKRGVSPAEAGALAARLALDSKYTGDRLSHREALERLVAGGS